MFLVGKAEHPEVIGTISFCEKGHYIIEKIEDAHKAVKEFKKTNIRKGGKRAKKAVGRIVV